MFGNTTRTPNNETALKHSFLSNRTSYLLLLFAEGKGKVVNILRVSLMYLTYITQFNPQNSFVEKKNVSPPFPVKSQKFKKITHLTY